MTKHQSQHPVVVLERVAKKHLKSNKKRKCIPSYFSSESDQEVWICVVCKEEWEGDDNRWIVCDLCDEPFHLQCSRIEYKEKDYYNIDIESFFFKCKNCTDDV